MLERYCRWRVDKTWLFAAGLLSKWGNSDGDALDDWWFDVADEPLEDAHGVLWVLVREHLVPVIVASPDLIVGSDRGCLY